MNQSDIAELTTLLSFLFSAIGVTGVTGTDISGFLTVIGGIVTLGAMFWARFAHKNEVAVAAGTKLQ